MNPSPPTRIPPSSPLDGRRKVAEVRRREETKRQLALVQNPANLLRAVTAPGASRTDGGVGSAAKRAGRPDAVPFIPVEKLVFARESAQGYDARLDKYAAERARRAKEASESGLTAGGDRGERRGGGCEAAEGGAPGRPVAGPATGTRVTVGEARSPTLTITPASIGPRR